MKNPWKSTKKKLPEDGEEVIFIAMVPFTTKGDVVEKQCVGRWVHNSQRFYIALGHYYELDVVTYWAHKLKSPSEYE